MDKKVPFYLLEKKNTVRIILFTAFFALLFINLFQPFGSRNWYPNISDFKYFFFSSLIILTGMLVVVVSRLFMGLYIRRHE
ncbi:MAG TPA: LytTR family transcriptional regulator, partial [Paludibacter sp.]|nr:LytTR family transcriptional regulator [Paludibacter sp.]